MLDAIRAEWLKAITGRALLITAGVGVGLSLLTSYGYAKEGDAGIIAGTTDVAAVTGDIVRTWMALYLFAAIYGALMVTKEFNSRTIGRTVLVAGRRDRVFAAKTITALLLGVIFGLLAVAFGIATSWLMLLPFGRSPEWTREVVLTTIGVFACSVLAAAWGVFLGWIIRHQVATVLTILVLTLLIEPAVQRIVPDFSAYLLTIALSSIYRDGKPELLAVPAASAVVAAWLLVAALVGRQTLARRDIP